MEESYQLKEHCSLSLFEQKQMVAEERAWWLKRKKKDVDEQNKQHGDMTSRIPSIPSIPSIPRP